MNPGPSALFVASLECHSLKTMSNVLFIDVVRKGHGCFSLLAGPTRTSYCPLTDLAASICLQALARAANINAKAGQILSSAIEVCLREPLCPVLCGSLESRLWRLLPFRWAGPVPSRAISILLTIRIVATSPSSFPQTGRSLYG